MSATFTSLTGFRCPKCGGELGGFPPDDACIGIRCLSCDYVGAVTTNPNRPSFDRTPYDVWVDAGTKDRLSVIAAGWRGGEMLSRPAKPARGSMRNSAAPIGTDRQTSRTVKKTLTAPAGALRNSASGAV